ncbi:MAG: hypothetical protein LBK03_06030 [Bacteroidales bacterium]|jgi:hypothetical protein|nr:hypothetical protein [Bacteroidales bacterium]
MRIDYFIDEHKFRDCSVFVKSGGGLFDRPKLKKPLSHSWAEEHGESVDLELMVYEPRKLTLDCFFVDESAYDFMVRLPYFLGLFSKNRLLQLRVEVNGRMPLLYMVYPQEEISVIKRFRDGKMTGTFKLTLVEPEPVKRVYRLTVRQGGYVGDLGIAGGGGHYYNAYIADKKLRTLDGWDDTENLPNLNAGIYYLVITGSITDGLQTFVTAQETVDVTYLWPKL